MIDVQDNVLRFFAIDHVLVSFVTMLQQARFLAYNSPKPFGGRAPHARTRWESLSAPSDPKPQNKGPTSKGRGRKGKEWDRIRRERTGGDRKGGNRKGGRAKGRDGKVGRKGEGKGGGERKREGDCYTPVTQIPGSVPEI